MRPRTLFLASVRGTALVLAATISASAFAAQGEPGAWPPAPDIQPEWTQAPSSGRLPTSVAYGMDPRARAEWVNECRRRVADSGNGLGAAVVGGVIGGLAGNRIAGSGARTVGTVAGAAIGAVAGAAIDQAQNRSRANDACEAYYDDYYMRYSQSGYGPSTVMIPVMVTTAGSACANAPETVSEAASEEGPGRARIIRRTVVRRVQAAPDNRVR